MKNGQTLQVLHPTSIRDMDIEVMGLNPVSGLNPMAFHNCQRVLAVRPDDKVLLLLDSTLDPRVTRFLWQLARGHGAQVQALIVEAAGTWEFPEEAKPLIEAATLVFTTWFSSSLDPYFFRLRQEKGQRYVKLTYFRSLDLMKSEAAAFPIDIISMLVRKTAQAFPSKGSAEVRIRDERGTDLKVTVSEQEIKSLMAQSRWRGEMTAERPGAYVHWIPMHGPNFWDFSATPGEFEAIEGVIAPRRIVGFVEEFPADCRIRLNKNRVTAVEGPEHGPTATLREMLLDGKLIEIGCGFNPKHSRNQIYPAGSNSAGALHLGLDLPRPSAYLSGVLPDWPEPPEHVDAVLLDATVTINGAIVVDKGVLQATRDPEIRTATARYGRPEYLLDVLPNV